MWESDMITERSIRRDMRDEGYNDDEIEEAVDRLADSQIDRYEARQEELNEEIWP